MDTLFAELKRPRNDNDEGDTVLPPTASYHYQWRFNRSDQYRRWYRAAGSHEREQVDPNDWVTLLDENALAADQDYFRLGAMSVSPNNQLIAYSIDTDGSERFTLHVVDWQPARQ